MALTKSLGATFSFSAALPASHDQTGFELLTFTKVGELSAIPDLDGKRDVATFDNLETGSETKFADIMRAGSGTLTVGLDDADAGQILLDAAVATGAKGCMKVTLSNGAAYYRNCIVTSNIPSVSFGKTVTAEVNLEFELTTVKVPAP